MTIDPIFYIREQTQWQQEHQVQGGGEEDDQLHQQLPQLQDRAEQPIEIPRMRGAVLLPFEDLLPMLGWADMVLENVVRVVAHPSHPEGL